MGVASAVLGEHDTTPTSCVMSSNFMNAQYTVEVSVGTPPQTLDAVPDTGSFELIVSSEGCDGCAPHRLYSMSQSSSGVAREPAVEVETNFGQGKVTSRVVHDRVTVGSRVVLNQSLLAMRTNELRGFADASYDAVMGLGMQGLARANDSDLSLMSSWGIDAVSVCLGQRDGDPGRLQLGGGIPGLHYVTHKVIADAQHWAVHMHSVAVGGGDAIGCTGAQPCAAIFDSGTSLIAVPPRTLDALLEQVGEVRADCSNVDTLPTITLMLGEHRLTLPPQLYVARLKDVEPPEEEAGDGEQAGRGLFRHRFEPGRLVEACLPLFMEMDMSAALAGDVWILGMPFFRAYSATFNRRARTVALGQVELGSDLCTSCADAPAARASAGGRRIGRLSARASRAAAVAALVPRAPPGRAAAVGGRKVAPSRMSFKSLLFPSWAVRESRPFPGAPSKRVLTL